MTLPLPLVEQLKTSCLHRQHHFLHICLIISYQQCIFHAVECPITQQYNNANPPYRYWQQDRLPLKGPRGMWRMWTERWSETARFRHFRLEVVVLVEKTRSSVLPIMSVLMLPWLCQHSSRLSSFTAPIKFVLWSCHSCLRFSPPFALSLQPHS